MGTVHKLITLLASLLLLLLIVIYDEVGTYNETTIVDWYVDVDVDDELYQYTYLYI